MDISNITEFRNFVECNQLTPRASSFGHLVQCVNNYEKGCNCWNTGERERILNECKTYYVASVNHISSNRAEFQKYSPDKKLRFYQDGRLLLDI